VSLGSSEERDGATSRVAERRAVLTIRDGDRDSFGQLVEMHERRLFGLTFMIVRDSSGAEEITQDAFLRAFTYLDRYDERRPFYPWIATIAVRLAQTWLGRRQRQLHREGAKLEPALEPAGPDDPLADFLGSERDVHLWRCVAALPAGERTAVYLYYRQELKVTEVARTLGVTNGTVKTLLFRARRRLRLELEASRDAARSPSPESRP